MGKIETEKIIGIYTEQNIPGGEMLCEKCLKPTHVHNLFQEEIIVNCRENVLFFCDQCGRQFNKGGRTVLDAFREAGLGLFTNLLNGRLHVRGISKMKKKKARDAKRFVIDNKEELIACIALTLGKSRKVTASALEEIHQK